MQHDVRLRLKDAIDLRSSEPVIYSSRCFEDKIKLNPKEKPSQSFSPASQHFLYDLGEVLEVSLAIDAVLVRQRLYDAVDLRSAERGVARVAVLVSRSAF